MVARRDTIDALQNFKHVIAFAQVSGFDDRRLGHGGFLTGLYIGQALDQTARDLSNLMVLDGGFGNGQSKIDLRGDCCQAF